MKTIKNQIKILETKAERAYKIYQKNANSSFFYAYENYKKAITSLTKAINDIELAESYLK